MDKGENYDKAELFVVVWTVKEARTGWGWGKQRMHTEFWALQFVDGWELNGQFFPSADDHPKPLSQRYREFCGQRRVKQVLQSSQNAAVVQYRLPHRGNGFSFTARFPRNAWREYETSD